MLLSINSKILLICIFKKQDCSSQQNWSMLILFKRFSGEPFMLLDDYLQYHIPFTFMLVYQFPLLHISAEIYCEKDTNICWRWTRCRQEAPPQRGRWRPRDSNTSCVNVSQVCVCVWERKEEEELRNSFGDPESRACAVNGRPWYRWEGV